MTAAAPAGRGWVVRDRAAWATAPNAITLVRTAASIALALPALVQRSWPLLIAAYLCYWVGDMLDGAVARLLRQESRVGAVFDIVADRACASLCAAALVTLEPSMALPIGIFLAQFMVLDCGLSLTFLRWPLLSPNYFGLVHRAVYLWNWSPVAKAINTGALVVLVLVAPSPVYPAVFAVAVAVVKAVSLVAVARLVP
jgi:CDP-diacylglycerol--glycerol-3-phosphate 3-phosphatidyltransferase